MQVIAFIVIALVAALITGHIGGDLPGYLSDADPRFHLSNMSGGTVNVSAD